MNKRFLIIIIGINTLLGAGSVLGARISDVRGTVHNLAHEDTLANYTLTGGALPVRTVTAIPDTAGVCVFCHTAHNASVGSLPLWNKTFTLATYIPYTSSSLDALADQGVIELDQPDDNSKMCLSCHDGTVAIGAVSVFNSMENMTIPLDGTSTAPIEGAMPASRDSVNAGDDTGYTRRLGTDLRNDHPISVTYTASLASRDGELRMVDAAQQSVFDGGRLVGPRTRGVPHVLPLFGSAGSAQLQCPTCHDPHVRDDNVMVGNQKFLRLNRFQESQGGTSFNEETDIICLACHDKGGTSWAYSAHANSFDATQTYLTTPGDLREFPPNMPVWKASCLNCHDTHTVEGAPRLLREATDSFTVPKTSGNPATEETCFQCHTAPLDSIITNVTASGTVPDIKSDYDLSVRMPLRSGDQRANAEMHDIGGVFDESGFLEGGANCATFDNKCGADFVEQRVKLGAAGSLVNRHAECSDCHHPHRVVKFRDFRGRPFGTLMGITDAAGTHNHDAGHTNIASGVLRGMTGVEPVYNLATASFDEMPTSFNVKRGDPAGNVDANTSAQYVTREYQVCLKCHSNYGYEDDNIYPVGSRPNLIDTPSGGTPSGTNLLTQYTNQAKEFQAPEGHKGQPPITLDSGAFAGPSVTQPPATVIPVDLTTNNQRSWHPVMDHTGRTPLLRGGGIDAASPDLWLPPWNGLSDVGNQTMYCSDCHGSATEPSTGGSGTVVPVGGEDGASWGPHGSSLDFLLKGQWDRNVGAGNPDALCFRCHDYDQYANPSPPGGKKRSGFSGLAAATAPDNDVNLHVQHAAVMTTNPPFTPMRCSQCHIAVPHGWKNKGLLVNLNDVGPEAGVSPGTWVPAGATGYDQQPYYMGAWLRVTGFAKSGEWKKSDCTGSCH